MKAAWINTTEAAAIIGCTIPTVTRLIKSGDLNGHKWGRDYRINRRSAEAVAQKPKPTGRKRGQKDPE